LKYNNKFDLPETISRAVKRAQAAYNKGPAHRSCTELIAPPRIGILRRKHYDQLETDISDNIWSLLGTAVHHIMEMGADEFQAVEQRLYVDVDGWVVSGALDCQTLITEDGVSIEDYKCTSAFNVMKGQEDDEAKREWVEQLNIQAYLVEANRNVEVTDLSIIAIVRDWSRQKATYDKNYPQSPIVRYPVPLWSKEEREAFIKERIVLHRNAEMNAALGLPLPECTAHDRWERNGSIAVIKKGGKRASAVCQTMEEAETVVAEKGDGYEIVVRPGQSVRCQGNYCGVAQWCEQYQRIKDGVQDKDE
jgi:hypothetical protein